ncbi:hypothetical protein [Agrococcus sp. TF02-05]|uniref:hypothetical protein n=1 Tax=Agrococcus sp. TF02-05 TaxID=2815211 RepID=UPI001AA1D385|nr:hypothetical protein [Agrococcus sp. TF02-05]MBO1770492.1 hypothetical protein [Agrococcus sp. TF02-05]
MPAGFAVVLAVVVAAVVLALVGIAMSIRGTGSTPKRGGWLALLSGLVALCCGVTLFVSVLGGLMDDQPGLW